MSNSYYNHTTYPTPNSPGSSSTLRLELDAITTGFSLLPTLAANGYKVAMVNSAGTALIASSALQSLAITLSTLNSTPIGASSPSTGAFTTVSATTFTGALTGNASTATALATARTIGGTSFDGTANVTSFPVPGAIGGTTPSTGAFTSITASTTLGVTGVATFTAQPIVSSLTASKPVFTDASKGLTSSGTLAYDQGGTGQTSYAAGDIVYASGINTLAKLAIGTSGQRLVVAAGVPSWATDTTVGTVTSVSWTGGIVSVATATTTPAFTIAGTSGGVPYFSSGTTWATSAALAANALVIGGGAGAAPSTTTTGTGVVTALGVNTGSAGAFVVNGGALGSPSSVGTMPAFTLGGTIAGGGNQINNVVIGTTTPLAGAFTTLSATGATTLSAALTYGGVTLTNAVTGTGKMVLDTSPTFVTPALGTPSALVGTNITGTATAFTASNVTTNANLTGDITSVGNATTLTNAPVIAKVLTGYVSGAGTVAATDSILQAIQKLNGNDATNANLTGAVTSVGNATSLGSFTSLQLLGALTDETGTGANVFATSPTLVTPILGTPASGTVTNLTGTASININGTVGATTANTGAFTTLSATGAGSTGGFTSTASGTAASPSIQVYGGGEMGFYRITTNQLGIAAGGVLAATVTSTGLAVTGTLSATGDVTLSGQILLDNNKYIGFKNTTGTYAASIFNDTSNFLNLYNSGNTGTIFYVNAAEQMRLTSTGLGIGTSSPTKKLSITGTGNNETSGSIQTTNSNAGTGTQVGFWASNGTQSAQFSLAGTGYTTYGAYAAGNIAIYNDQAITLMADNASTGIIKFATGGSTEKMRLDSSGNLGIGTSSPSGKLHVAGGASNVQIYLSNNSYSTYYYQNTGGTSGVSFPASQAYIWDAGGTERARIDSSGNLGIGTSSPAAKLEIKADNNEKLILNATLDTNNYQNQITFQNAGTTYAAIIAGKNASNNSIGLVFNTGTTEKMRLDSSGNLGIATTSPTSLLTIGQGSFTAASSNTTGMYTASSGSGLVVLTDAFTVAARVTGATIFGVGTGGVITSPGTYSNTSAGAANMFVQTDGTFYRSTSSLRYKNNVQDATHGLADLLQLRPVTYEGKAETDAGKTFGGLIAEEVHEAGLTEFVQYAEDGSPDSLAYGNMVSLCIKAIQEQQALITQLTARITALETA